MNTNSFTNSLSNSVSFLNRPEVKSLMNSAMKTGLQFADSWMSNQRAKASARSAAIADAAQRVQQDVTRAAQNTAQNIAPALPAILREDSEDSAFPVSLMAGLVVGGLVGAAAALLMTPQSGRATQRQIKRKAARVQRTLTARANNFADSAKSLAAKTSEDMSDLKDRAVETVNNTVEKLQTNP